MNIATLFGKLREHELELGRLKEEEDGEKRHIIALKSAIKSAAKLKKAEYVDDSNDGNSDNESFSLIVKRFSKFLKFKNKTNNSYAGNKTQSRKQDVLALQPTMSVAKQNTSNQIAMYSR